MSNLSRPPRRGLVSPFTTRLDPLQFVQTQSWNIVYVPYCTGDAHTGNKTAVYSDADPGTPLTYHHRGAVNAQAVAHWMAAHMTTPTHLLLTGFSAGGVGSTANYPAFRSTIKPKKMALLADAGPLFDVPRNATPEQAPSVLLHNKIRQAWGLDGPAGLFKQWVTQYPLAVDANNLGSLTNGIGKIFPGDRIGYTLFQEDSIFSAYSYQPFYPEIAAAATLAERQAMLNVKWRQEIQPWLASMASSNVGYYIPNKRVINGSHCTTIVTFGGSSIVEKGFRSVGVFVNNLLDGEGPVMRAYENNPPKQRVLLSDLFADAVIGRLQP
jgi:hypothetical protein